MDFSPLFEALKSNPTAALLAISLIAIGWLVRDSRQRDSAHAAALQTAHAAHLATAMLVAPLASKLVDCVEILERLMPRPGGA